MDRLSQQQQIVPLDIDVRAQGQKRLPPRNQLRTRFRQRPCTRA